MLNKWFLDHPHSVDETYLEHARTATGFALPMIAGGFACLIHAVLPSLFTHTGSRTIAALHLRMRGRAPGSES